MILEGQVLLHNLTGDVGAEGRAEADTRLVMEEGLPWIGRGGVRLDPSGWKWTRIGVGGDPNWRSSIFRIINSIYTEDERIEEN